MDTLETKRLILRGWEADDLEDLHDYSSDMRVGPPAGWKPHFSKEESVVVLADFIKNGCVWAIEYKENNKVIGSISLDKDAARRDVDCRELGYALSADYWGMGLMTEAARAVIDYGFETAGLRCISAAHFPGNDASRRVLEKCGFRKEGMLNYSYRLYNGRVLSTVQYIMMSEDWQRIKEGEDGPSLSEKLALIVDDNLWIMTNLANAAALIYDEMINVNWAGFYLWRDGLLKLGPFCGKPACTTIEMGKGVCGKAAESGKTIVVDDVHLFPGHIACDSASLSETVVPMYAGGKLIGVLDIDSPVRRRFKSEEKTELEKCAAVIEGIWPRDSLDK
ncbi:MAG: GNAT family N-acetyltransferase [Eubacteriaceae bacterium]|nr:GNAT family N-acetyltransferase [Eubacteriaceae bacterium]